MDCLPSQIQKDKKKGEIMSNNADKKTIKAERPGGFLDFLPVEFLAREKMLKTIEKIFQSYGFDPIETPMVEFEYVLSGETSDTGKNIFQVKSLRERETSGAKNLALRFDQTVPLARLLAANPYNPIDRTGIKLPWRRMVVGPVFRGESPQNGRYRQFYQFDADIAGSASMTADAEIISMMFHTLHALNINNFKILINNRKLLNGLADLVGIKERPSAKKEDLTREMMRILDKMDKIGFEAVVLELKREPINDFDPAPNLSKTGIEKIQEFLKIAGDNHVKITRSRDIFSGISIAEEGLDELEEILKHLSFLAIPENTVQINYSIARGLDYYTGTVMETLLLDAPQFGSVFSGGRFNDLVSRFTGQDLPAVGASIGVDRLFAALRHLGKIDLSKQTVSEVMILRLIPNEDGRYLSFAQEIRKQGLNCEVCLLDDLSFKSQFNYAISRGVKYVLICGENEKNKKTVQIKNLDKREQKEIPTDQIGTFFAK